MKDLKGLKKEQSCLKKRLAALIDYINSEEYFSLPVVERNQLNQERLGLELQLNALTNRVYNSGYTFDTSFSSMFPLLLSVLSTNAFGSSSGSNDLEDTLLKLKSEDVQE